mgnify:CR=1 FL=1
MLARVKRHCVRAQKKPSLAQKSGLAKEWKKGKKGKKVKKTFFPFLMAGAGKAHCPKCLNGQRAARSEKTTKAA